MRPFAAARRAPLGCVLASLLLSGCPEERAHPTTERAEAAAVPGATTLLPATLPPETDAPATAAGEAPPPPRPPKPAVVSDDDDDDPAEPPPPPASHATAAPQATRDRDQACTEADAGLKPLALVKFQLTSAIEDRQPVDELTAATAGERVWAYLSVDNRSADERCVTVTFRVNGKKRTSLSLDIGKSPTWRTWASQRLTKTDVGAELTVEVVDDQGKLLKEQALPVQESTPAGASATASARTSPPPPPASGP